MVRFHRAFLLFVAVCVAFGAGGTAQPIDAAGSHAALSGKLYFTRAGRLYMSNPDGSSPRMLTTVGTPKTPDEMPAVSRDGKHVAYVQWQSVSHSDPYGVYLLQPNGKPRDISGSDLFTFFPTWSPDGKELAYGTSVYYGAQSYSEIIIRRVSDDKSVDLIGNVSAPPSSPTWSPDGRTIVVEQLKWLGTTFVAGLQALDYAAMLASGQPKNEIGHALTNDPTHNYAGPMYSPDGRFIACVRSAVGASEGDLWVMNADGTGGHAVAHNAHPSRPAWSPDGSAIAFTRGTGVAIVSVDTGALQDTIPNATGPAWGGDGKTQPVASNPTGNPSPTPTSVPTPGAGTSGKAATVTITSAKLFKVVGSNYQATTTVHVGDSVLYALYYRAVGIDPSEVTGTLAFEFKGKVDGSFQLATGKATDGTPVLTTRLTFPPTKGLQATKMIAYFTVRWDGHTEHTAVSFTLEP